MTTERTIKLNIRDFGDEHLVPASGHATIERDETEKENSKVVKTRAENDVSSRQLLRDQLQFCCSKPEVKSKQGTPEKKRI